MLLLRKLVVGGAERVAAAMAMFGVIGKNRFSAEMVLRFPKLFVNLNR